jgi:hypothetical protein
MMGCDERSHVHPYLIEPWHPYLIGALACAPPGVWRPVHGRAGGRVPAVPRERFVSEDGVINTRARVLGGGSCLNAGFCHRMDHREVWKYRRELTGEKAGGKVDVVAASRWHLALSSLRLLYRQLYGLDPEGTRPGLIPDSGGIKKSPNQSNSSQT